MSLPNTLRRRLLTGLLVPAWGLVACAPRTPWRLGFIGSLSQGASDVGEAGRNGVILAVEQRNANGGVAGRPIELLIEDDTQNRERAGNAMRSLLDRGVVAVIGPFISAMAGVVAAMAESAGVPAISPTVTSMDFVGKDDMFFRIHRTTRDNAQDYSRVLLSRNQRRVAVAYDLGNRSFSESWLREFRQAFETGGGALVAVQSFESRPDSTFAPLVEALVGSRPDLLLLIANAVDVARLGQRARALAPQLPLAASEWAASETLLELGGRSLEGMLVLQPYDRSDISERFQSFRAAFVKRFNREPGYSSVAAFDAATVVFEALSRRDRDEPLKPAILRHGPYTGLQQAIQFDRFGDTQRNVVFAEIRDGRFELLR